jgi:hypothetical protein
MYMALHKDMVFMAAAVPPMCCDMQGFTRMRGIICMGPWNGINNWQTCVDTVIAAVTVAAVGAAVCVCVTQVW